MRKVKRPVSVNMYDSQPILLAKSNIEKLNLCHFVNVISDRSMLLLPPLSLTTPTQWGLCFCIKPTRDYAVKNAAAIRNRI